MIIAIVYNSAWYIYNFRSNLIDKLQEEGHTVVAISPVDEYVGRLEKLGVKHYPLSMKALSKNPLKEIKTLINLLALLRKIKPDYVLSYTVKCNLYVGLCGYLLPIKQIANISGMGEVFDRKGLLQYIVRFLYNVGFKTTKWIFFQNKEDLDLCVQKKLVDKKKSLLLPGSGVDLQNFLPAAEKNNQSRTFLMFGRLLPKKGYDLFLLAARELKLRYGDQVQFQIMGVEDKSRPESRKLFERINHYQSLGFIKVLPKTDNVLPVLQNIDVVVLPSTYNEGVPRSILEALACGKPIVTTDWKGCRETVEEGVNGYLVPPGNQAQLTYALESLTNMPTKTFQQMGKASRSLAERKFDENLVLSAYISHINSADSNLIL